ncbi:MAG: hypothetical protein KY459_10985 [Acidobacteria bacterium]|nr:hypothetical protein [Acidobacteriota bacterium]
MRILLSGLICVGALVGSATGQPRQDRTVVVDSVPVVLRGVTSLPAGSRVRVSIGQTTVESRSDSLGRWELLWVEPLPPGTTAARVEVIAGDRVDRSEILIRVEGEGRLPRRPILYPREEPVRGERAIPELEVEPFTDRWRITPPDDYELIVNPRGRWDPYNKHLLKGDFPIIGDEIFLSLTGISDSLFEGRTVPTPSGVSAENPGSVEFFGEGDQAFLNQNVVFTADLFRGQTVFRPAEWRARVTLIANFNALDVRETGVVNPDVRRGSDREDGQLGVQELFYERKLADLSDRYDFVSLRVGIQQFNSDFRGFIFNDFNLGARLFGNWDNNRYQYNLAVFDRLEKDTNSSLNVITERRHQQVAVANIYRQDLFTFGYTGSASIHYLRDEPTIFYDTNDILVRPDPIGDFTPHEIEAVYLGLAGAGKFGRLNVDNALYYVFGEDSHNPIAGQGELEGPLGTDGAEPQSAEVDISALMAALELSFDRDWYRPKIAIFYASGDDSIPDRDATGFDAIFDNPNFAGGGFSFWNRLGIRLAGTGVGLVHRGSLLPDLSSSKDEGQPNFVNPGIRLVSAGLDVEVTQKAKMISTINALWFDQTEVLEGVLFTSDIDREIGLDISSGVRYRPFLNNQMIVFVGGAVFVPGKGFERIYEDGDPLWQLFTNVTLAF